MRRFLFAGLALIAIPASAQFESAARHTLPAGACAITLDPSTLGTGIALSGGNRTMSGTASGGDQGAKGVAAFALSSSTTVKKVYFEFTPTGWVGGADSGVGIATPASTYANLGASATVGGIYFSSGNLWVNGSNVGNAGIGIGSGLVGEIAADFTNNKIWFRGKGRNWDNTAGHDPATNTGGFALPSGQTWLPLGLFNNGTGGNTLPFNFGQTAFSDTVPAGFAGWPGC